MDRRDLSPYLRPVRLSGFSGVFLARALLEITPEDASPALLRAAASVRERAEHIRLTLMARSLETPSGIRESDVREDTGLIAIRDGLEATARLTPSELASRAAALLPILFPDGTQFLRLPAHEQWGRTEVLLQRIDRDGHAAEIETVLRPEFLTFLREAHDAYGRALGIGHDATDDPESNALRETIDDLSLAIADYARVLAGELVRGDEASEDRFRRAVAPIDAFREALSRRHGAGDEPEPETDIENPLPEVDAPTPVVDEPAPVPVEG